MNPSSCSLRARWVFPVESEPIPSGVVTLCKGRIVDVGLKGRAPLVDLGNTALVPGFVNAHTHLEFSDLRRPLETPEPFAAWIHQLMALRRDERRDVSLAIRSGLDECARSGTTLVGEIASSPDQTAFVETSPVGCVVFLELIGLSEERAAIKNRQAADHLSRPIAENRIWGLSPHAPYTVRPSLLRDAVRLARDQGAPVAMHVAETREELRLLSDAAGPLAAMLKSFGAWQEGIFDPSRRPLDVLEEMVDLPHGLVVHGNYLQEDEIALLARCSENLTVVYCPRTHAYFGHSEHPFLRLLDQGASIAIGTDSRASNPDLSVLEELRFLHRRYPDVAGSLLLRLGTLAGAAGLGQGEERGSLRPGKRADLAVVALPERGEEDPHRLLFASDLPVCATFYGGRCVYSELAEIPAALASEARLVCGIPQADALASVYDPRRPTASDRLGFRRWLVGIWASRRVYPAGERTCSARGSA